MNLSARCDTIKEQPEERNIKKGSRKVKKFVLFFVTLISVLMFTITAFAVIWEDDDPMVGDYAFIINPEWNGRKGTWQVEGRASRFQVRLYRNDKRVSLNNNETTSTSFNFSSYMTSSGDYYFEVRAYARSSGSWGDWVQSDEEYFKGSGGSSDPVSPSYPISTVNGWSAVPGGWSYYRNGNPVKNDWVLDGQFWYWFDGNGKMLTGWQWINRKCYYLNPNSAPNAAGFPYGACWMNGTTPDGYTVNASGAWTVNGVEQIR